MKDTLLPDTTAEQLLSLMRNLKCKVFHDNTIIVSEVNKKQRLAFEAAKILVPKNHGV
jgi:hypothetical protein